MITKEEILTRLMEERDKISKEKQITDKWIQVRADKLFEGVTEETDIEELSKFTVEVMPEMQANMNSILKLESEKIKEELAKKIIPEEKPLDPKYKVESNLIDGCQSRVWLQADYEDGKIVFSAESDALIVKGII